MTKKEQVVELLKQGKTPLEISTALKIHSSNVYKMISEYKQSEKMKEMEKIINSNK